MVSNKSLLTSLQSHKVFPYMHNTVVRPGEKIVCVIHKISKKLCAVVHSKTIFGDIRTAKIVCNMNSSC